MAATIGTMAMLNAKCLNPPKITNPSKAILTTKPISIPKGLITDQTIPKLSSSMAIAGAIFSTLSTCDAAFAVQQLADIAEGSDNRGLALLLPLIPAIAWVLFNILQPALNQINRMRTTQKGVVIGLGLGGGVLTSGFGWTPPEASAAGSELAMLADAAAGGSDGRGQLLLIVITPAILWVLYNILQPALNQINKMRS